MKLRNRIFLGIAIFAILGGIFYSRVFSYIVIAILLAQLIDYRRIILLSNPFDRKIDSSIKKSCYFLWDISTNVDITLCNNASASDLTLAMCEYISRQSDHSLSHRITVSSNGDTSVYSDAAFLPFSLQNSSLSFRNLEPVPFVDGVFICGSVPCSHIEIPINTKYLSIQFRCHAKSLSIPGDTMPFLLTEYSEVHVPENFTVKVPPELNEAALSDSSWSEVQFIGPSGESIDPFRNIRQTRKTFSSCPYIYRYDE